jgi:hypothetical protein
MKRVSRKGAKRAKAAKKDNRVGLALPSTTHGHAGGGIDLWERLIDEIS